MLLLRPGLPVVRRDARTLQVGLHAPLTCRLEDTPEVRALLGALRTGTTPDDLATTAERALGTLLAAGLVFDGDPRPAERGADAARAQYGGDAARRLAARAAVPVAVVADPGPRRVVAELLGEAGLTVDNATPAIWLVVATGPVARESLDPLVRAGLPHLVVSGDAAGRRVGPFVDPGRTACVRCVDAHDAESDPRRPFLLEQAALAADATPPTDPVLDRLALAWAVRDLCRYVEGDEPSTWSTTVDIGPDRAPEVIRWLRHPHCGCAWDIVLDA